MRAFLVILIPALSFILALITIDDYGINWDEPYHYRRGQAFLHYYLTGKKTYEGLPKYPPLKGTTDTPGFRNSDELFNEVLKNPSLSDPNFRRSYYQNDAWNGEFFIDVENPSGHPPLNDTLASLFNKIFYQKLGIFGDIESYHLFIISAVSLAAFFIAIFMWREFGLIESIITSLALVTYPLLLGEQHFNIKDPVETAFYSITIIGVYLGVKRNKLFWFLLGTLFFAFALSTKFNIVFSIIPLGIWFFATRVKATKKIYLALLVSPLIIFGVFFLSYPALWQNLPNGFMKVVDFYLREGFSNPQSQSPALWIIYTTAPIVLALILAGMINIRKLIRESTFTLLVVLWLTITVGRVSLPGMSSYGGARLIMEYIPALSMFAGISAGYLIRGQKTKYSTLFLLIILLGFLPSIIKLIQIHPNENVYFNFIVGGLSGAKEKNLDSWGNSYGNAYYPAITWLNKNSEKDSRLTLPINSIVNIPRYKLRGDISLSETYWSGPSHEGEYVLELTHNYPPRNWYSLKYLETVMEPVYEVKVDGVAIAKLWKNDSKFVKEEYRNLKKIALELDIKKVQNQLIINLPEIRKLMQISIDIPTQNCKPIKTGFVRTSVDDTTWSREPEDIARDQLKQAAIREAEDTFDFYFVAKDTKIIVFEIENEDACLLSGSTAWATVLQVP